MIYLLVLVTYGYAAKAVVYIYVRKTINLSPENTPANTVNSQTSIRTDQFKECGRIKDDYKCVAIGNCLLKCMLLKLTLLF